MNPMRTKLVAAVVAVVVIFGGGAAVARASADATLHGNVGPGLVAPSGAQPLRAGVLRPKGYVRNPSGCSSYMVEGQARGSCGINNVTRGHYLRLVNECYWPEGTKRTNWIYGQGIAISTATGTCGASAAHYWEMS